MRSRTELVTTTFDLDSDEEDYSPDDDDSEEDWRPNKKRQQKQSRANANGSSEAARRKRRTTGSSASKPKRRAIATKVSDDDFESADDDGDGDDDELDTEPSDAEDVECPAASTSFTKRPQTQSLPPKKQFNKPDQLDLLINKRELCAKDWLQSSRLCLWRKDEQTQLLQKYLRVRTSLDSDKPEEQQLLFTSSSVYSSWDEQHISDFVAVKANCLDPNNRRIQLADLEAIKKLSIELQEAQDNTETAKSQLDSNLRDELDDDDDDDDDDDEQVGA
ncbi:hypothetical protein ACLKA6_012401 [Drosophila palustris]